MTTTITYWGASCFEVESPGTRVLIDPFISGNPKSVIDVDQIAPPDLILITHTSGRGNDHFGDAAEIAIRSNAKVICDRASQLLMIDKGVPRDNVVAGYLGGQLRVGQVLVHPLISHHMSWAELSSGQYVHAAPLAMLFEPEPGVRVYHYGDTAIFDMNIYGDLYSPTVALLGCDLPRETLDGWPAWVQLLSGELTPDECGRVAEMLRVKVAIACHYLSRGSEADEFVEAIARHDSTGVRVGVGPEAGDFVVVEPAGLVATGSRQHAA